MKLPHRIQHLRPLLKKVVGRDGQVSLPTNLGRLESFTEQQTPMHQLCYWCDIAFIPGDEGYSLTHKSGHQRVSKVWYHSCCFYAVNYQVTADFLDDGDLSDDYDVAFEAEEQWLQGGSSVIDKAKWDRWRAANGTAKRTRENPNQTS